MGHRRRASPSTPAHWRAEPWTQHLIERLRRRDARRVRPHRAARRVPGVPRHPGRPLHERRVLGARAGSTCGRASWVLAGPGRGRRRGRRLLHASTTCGCRSSSIRGKDDVVRAFYNTCQHRGAPVVREQAGTARTLRCQYHSWTYDITEGQLIAVPDERDFVGLDKADALPAAAALRDLGRLDLRQPGPRRDAAAASGWRRSPSSSPSCRDRRCARWRAAARSCRATGRSPPRPSSRCTTSATSTSATARATSTTAGATMGLLPNGASRMITPFSKVVVGGGRDGRLGRLAPRRDAGVHRHRDGQRHGALHQLGLLDLPQPDHADRRLRVPVHHVLAARQAHDAHRLDPLRADRLRPRPTGCRRTGSGGWSTFDRIMGEDFANMAPMQRSLESPAFRGMPINYQERRIWHFNEQLDRDDRHRPDPARAARRAAPAPGTSATDELADRMASSPSARLRWALAERVGRLGRRVPHPTPPPDLGRPLDGREATQGRIRSRARAADDASTWWPRTRCASTATSRPAGAHLTGATRARRRRGWRPRSCSHGRYEDRVERTTDGSAHPPSHHRPHVDRWQRCGGTALNAAGGTGAGRLRRCRRCAGRRPRRRRGCRPVLRRRAHRAHGRRVAGAPGEFDHSSAYGQWGSVMVELVQEHTAPLVEPGSGVHHLAFMVEPCPTPSRGARSGAAGAARASTSGGQQFAFMDARAELGHLVELYEPSERLLAFYAKVAAPPRPTQPRARRTDRRHLTSISSLSRSVGSRQRASSASLIQLPWKPYGTRRGRWTRGDGIGRRVGGVEDDEVRCGPWCRRRPGPSPSPRPRRWCPTRGRTRTRRDGRSARGRRPR